MGKRESGIQSGIVEAAVKLYGNDLYIRVKHGDAFAVAGDPDIYGCLLGRFFGFEVKNEDGELTKIQLRRLFEIRQAGAIGQGVKSVEEALQWLQHIENLVDLRRR